jgi:hypothetical protein
VWTSSPVWAIHLDEVVGVALLDLIAISWTCCLSDSVREAASRIASADTPRMGALRGPARAG